MAPKMSGSIRGRVALSQRAWTLPDGSPLGWWALAPAGDPGGDRHAREAARQIPTEHRETAWLRDEHGRTWWALLDTRTDRAAYASTRDELPEPEPAVEAEPDPAAVGVEPEPVIEEPDDVEPDPEPDDVEPVPAAVGVEPVPADETEPPEELTMPTTDDADHSRALIAALRNFDVAADVADVTRGATVDRYLLRPGMGVKVSQMAKLSEDLALALDVPHVRVLPSRGHVAVEVPAAERSTVTLADVAEGLTADHPLRVPVGVDVAGHGISARLDRLPHLLVAGTTGSGKSTWTSAILAHVVTHASPRDVQLALIDPKRVELAPFAGVPHLWRPVATSVERAVEVLEALVEEIEARYERLEVAGRRTVEDLPASDRPPYLLLVVDELADLMMTAGKRAESALVRVLQIGRAAGVHAILATQRPSADVVTPLIKANTPSRLTFAVQSHVDSGVALGQSGAETLLGQGDGLWWPADASQPERIQAPYVSSEELEELLAPLRRAEPTPESLGDRCEARRQRTTGDTAHLCECKRDAYHLGAHTCGECGLAWPARLSEPATSRPAERPTVPASELPPEPASPPAPEYVALEERTRELARMRSLDHDIEEAMDLAYKKGLRHGQRLAQPLAVTYRVMLGRDWAVAVAVFLGIALAGLLLLPLLPLVVGGAGAYIATRRRRSMTRYGYNLPAFAGHRETMCS